MSRYLSILRRRAALLPFVAAVVARLPIAMVPLGMVLLIQGERGRYAIAGVVTATFAVGSAVSAPLLGRLMDRRGQSVVIAPVSVVSAVVLVALALAVVRGGSDALLVVLAGAVGLTFPPISPAMRVAWRITLDSDLDRRAAYALDAVAVESIFVGGPLLLSLLALSTPVVPLLVTAAFLGLGGLAYALTPAARAARGELRGDVSDVGAGLVGGRSPLAAPGVRIALGVALTLAIGFGLSDVSIAATARGVLGSTAWVGLLFAAIAGGSATGGLWYGARHWHRPEEQRLPVSLGGFAMGLAAVAALLRAENAAPALLLPLMFVTGLCIAPSLIVLANLVDHHAPADRLSEAQSWLNTAYTSGGALGTALAGAAVDSGGPTRGFAVGAVAVALSTSGALVVARLWRADATT